MKQLRNIFLAAMACSVMVIAAGDTGNGAGDTSGNGAQDGAMMDTVSTMGIVMELNTTDSILLVQTDTAIDTFYMTANTQMPPEQELSQGTRVEIRYIDMDGRKELVSVKAVNAQGSSLRKTSFKRTKGSNGSNGTNGEMRLTGTIEEINSDDSMMTLQTEDGSETVYFDGNTKMNMDQLNEGSKVKVRFKTENDRKVATEITVSGNGQNGKKSNNNKNGNKK